MPMEKRISILLLFLLVGIMLSAANCVRRVAQQGGIEQSAQLSIKEREWADREKILAKAFAIASIRPKIVYQQRVVLKHPLTGEDIAYTMDCSGFVSAVYKSVNLDIFEKRGTTISGENGVKIIYGALEAAKKIYRKKIPAVADLVFFDNTYDRNGNGALDDELTHIGIVVSVSSRGTITFIHSSTGEGITRGYANLSYPNQNKLAGEVLNSNLRRQMPNDPKDTKYYAGALIHAFGTIFDIPQGGEDF
jgi:NlpC/P60 family